MSVVTSTPTIRLGQPEDVPELTTLAAAAFLGGDAAQRSPLARWLFPTASTCSALLPLYLRALIEQGLNAAAVTVATRPGADAPVGVAVWWRGRADHDDYRDQLADLLLPRHLRELDFLDAVRLECAPSGLHAYLALVAVTPAWQERGVGTALIRQHLAVLHPTAASYTVTDDRHIAEWLSRLGYQQRLPSHLPEGGPQLLPLVAAPRSGEGVTAS